MILSADYRVRPLDHLQWVMEARKKARDGRLQRDTEDWRPLAYCRTRAGLETALSRLRCEGIHLDAGLLACLPYCFDDAHGDGCEVLEEAR
jgi:hypothetical protein